MNTLNKIFFINNNISQISIFFIKTFTIIFIIYKENFYI
jgi:hypothetical protein